MYVVILLTISSMGIETFQMWNFIFENFIIYISNQEQHNT